MLEMERSLLTTEWSIYVRELFLMSCKGTGQTVYLLGVPAGRMEEL